MSNMCAKTFHLRTFINQLVVTYRFFKKLPQISHSYKIVIFKYNWNSEDQQLLPVKFHVNSMTGTLFLNFARRESLSKHSRVYLFLRVTVYENMKLSINWESVICSLPTMMRRHLVTMFPGTFLSLIFTIFRFHILDIFIWVDFWCILCRLTAHT